MPVPGDCKILVFSKTFRQAVGTTFSVHWEPESLPGETERSDHEANNSSSVEVKKGWSYTSPSFICRYVVRLGTFKFTFNVYMMGLQVSSGC